MRVQIVGTAGSGKTTFAKKLSKVTNYPHVEIDNLQFKENWVKLSDHDFDKLLAEAIKGQDWIACGNYFSSNARIYEKADYIIWLEYPLWKIFWRVTCRTLRRIWTKEPTCNGNVETIRRQFFSSESIYVWVCKSYKKRIKKYTQMSKDPHQSHKWILVRNEQQKDNALKTLPEKIKQDDWRKCDE